MISPSFNHTNPEHTSQFKLIKDPYSIRVTDRLINKTKPVTLYESLLTSPDTDKKFDLAKKLLKKRTIKNYNPFSF